MNGRYLDEKAKAQYRQFQRYFSVPRAYETHHGGHKAHKLRRSRVSFLAPSFFPPAAEDGNRRVAKEEEEEEQERRSNLHAV